MELAIEESVALETCQDGVKSSQVMHKSNPSDWRKWKIYENDDGGDDNEKKALQSQN